MNKLSMISGILLLCFIGIAISIDLLYPYIENHGRISKPEFTQHELRQLDNVISAYVEDTGTLPGKFADLVLDPNIERWNGPYIPQTALVDAWNNKFIYAKIHDDTYLLLSTGANGKLFGQGEDSVLFSPRSGPTSIKGFNRTPESPGPAKPGESGGGAG